MGKFPQAVHEEVQRGKHSHEGEQYSIARMELWEEWNRVCSPTPSVSEEEESAGGVGTWERTDNPATPTTTQQ